MATRNNQLTSLYIFCILKLDASKEHPFSAPMVHRRLQALGISLDRKTVLNHIKLLTDELLSAEQNSSSFLASYLGCTVHRYRKADTHNSDMENYVEIDPYESVPEGITLYYCIEGTLSPEELELIQNTIEINQYISSEQTTKLLSSLEQLKPFSYRNRPIPAVDSHMQEHQSSGRLFKNISLLRVAIRTKKKVQILYGRYDASLNLKPTKSGHRIISPYAIMASNGYSYLIAIDPKYGTNTTNFRIDRILELTLTEIPCDPLPESLLPYFPDAAHSVFQASKYRNDHPVMHSDKAERIHLLCHPAIINNLLDDFGLNIKTLGSDHPDYPDWVHVTMNASLSGSAVFCIHHCHMCKVLAPDSLREKVLEALQKGLELYK